VVLNAIDVKDRRPYNNRSRATRSKGGAIATKSASSIARRTKYKSEPMQNRDLLGKEGSKKEEHESLVLGISYETFG
jgi:hypothetical protein